MQDNRHIDRIKRGAERLRQRNETLSPVLGALEPLLLAQAQAQDTLREAGLAPLAPDAERRAQGKPLMADRPMDGYADAFLTAARSILPAMAGAFPAVSDDMLAVLALFEDGSLPPATLMEACLAGDDAPLADAAGEAGADPGALRLAMEQCLRPILAVAGERAAEGLGLGAWGRPYCPSCGAPPSIAILRKGGEDDGFLTNHGGQRWLHCSRCATEWRFKRHACAHCGSEEGKDLKYYQPERHNGERADVCGACGRYLLAVDVRELVEEPEPDVAALGLIPLDMAMQKEGYEPLAPTTWNRFDP